MPRFSVTELLNHLCWRMPQVQPLMQHCQGHHLAMSLGAPCTGLFNASGAGDSAPSPATSPVLDNPFIEEIVS